MEQFSQFDAQNAPVPVPSIQWYPGHMTKTRRMMEKNVKLVDIVVELIDARIPAASRNPELSKLVGGKPRVVLLNKSDAADPNVTAKWISRLKADGIPALAVDCRSGKGLGAFLPLVRETLALLIERRVAKGMGGQAIRMMVVGVPNVGKSSFINRMAGSRRTKVEDRPGVTRGRQWVTLEGGVELLDTPGVLWPKFEDPLVGEKLAFTGAVKDDVIDIELLAMRLLMHLTALYPQLLSERYALTEQADAYEMLCAVGKKRGMLISGGEVNTERAAIMLLDEFRSGKIGRISLESPT